VRAPLYAAEYNAQLAIRRPADRVAADEFPEHRRHNLITVGVICLILAAIFNSVILWVIGGILAVLGVIFWILGAIGRAVGGRRHYY
jgi:hypothetical protein